MKKRLTLVSCTSLLLTLSACSAGNLPGNISAGDLYSLLTPSSQQQTTGNGATAAAHSVVWTSDTLPVSVDTAARRLKDHYGFVSDNEINAARNSGQGNAAWSASAMSEGSTWEAQPGSYYRMSRLWAGNDRLTLDIEGNSKHSVITATYISSNEEHLRDAWTSRLWKQLPEVAGKK